MNPQLSPLQVNPITGEPFLRLKQHRNIIITPPRTEDAQHLLEPLNDDRIYICLANLPHPYSSDHAETWIATVKSKTDSILKELESARDNPELIVTDGCPVRFLREIQVDGTELFIGDIGINRCNHGELMGPNGLDWDSKTEYEEENKKLIVGDPRIIWSIGDFLIPSHHGRGIMTDAVGTVIELWGLKRMKCEQIEAISWTKNIASQRVFVKNGFEEKRRVENHSTVEGNKRDVVLLEWRPS